MTLRSPIQKAMCLFVAMAAVFPVLPMDIAAAEENNDAIVHKVLLERTTNTCKEVLPAWFKSKHGVQDPKERTPIPCSAAITWLEGCVQAIHIGGWGS